eukprot:snap_masked-scaffold_26-processed-gene-3.24-mRNA-1 protein AED:0.79 eAED:1.00 QI:0/-1/0/1/-1/1/1/0/68
MKQARKPCIRQLKDFRMLNFGLMNAKVLEVKKVTPMKRSRRTKELSCQTVVKLKRKELQLTRRKNHRL